MLKRLALSLRRAGRRRLLDSRDPALRRRSPVAAAARASTSCCIRCSTSTTTLDPYFKIAYRFGAIFLSEALPGRAGTPGSGHRAAPEGDRGAARRSGEYYQDIGFVYYWHLRDYKAAAEWFQRAAEQPGAPNWLAAAGGRRCWPRASDRASRAVPVAADRAVGGGMAAAIGRSARCCSSTRSIRSIARRRSCRRVPPPPGEPLLVERPDRAAVRCPASRSIRPATPYRDRSRDGRVTRVAARRRSIRCRQTMRPAAAVTPDPLPLIAHVLLGLAFGSFLNVCIYRLPRRQSLVRPGSRCPRCGYALRWFDNIPVVSYVAARRACRTCRAPISIRYPIVELAHVRAVRAALLGVRLDGAPRSRGCSSRARSSCCSPSTSSTICCRTSSRCRASSPGWRSALVLPPGHRRCAHRHRLPAAACCG